MSNLTPEQQAHLEELVKRVRLKPEEMDALAPTKEEVDAYLAEPDDDVAASLDPQTKRMAARIILYTNKVAQAQLNKVLNDPDLAPLAEALKEISSG